MFTLLLVLFGAAALWGKDLLDAAALWAQDLRAAAVLRDEDPLAAVALWAQDLLGAAALWVELLALRGVYPLLRGAVDWFERREAARRALREQNAEFRDRIQAWVNAVIDATTPEPAAAPKVALPHPQRGLRRMPSTYCLKTAPREMPARLHHLSPEERARGRAYRAVYVNLLGDDYYFDPEFAYLPVEGDKVPEGPAAVFAIRDDRTLWFRLQMAALGDDYHSDSDFSCLEEVTEEAAPKVDLGDLQLDMSDWDKDW